MDSAPLSEQLEPYSQALFDAVMGQVSSWIIRRMHDVTATASEDVKKQVHVRSSAIATATENFVAHELQQLLAEDVDAQRTNPLQILRDSTRFATHALRELDVPEVQRDEFERKAQPGDVYALGPMTWRDLSDDVHEAGISWGAWKAASILQRRRAEGKIS